MRHWRLGHNPGGFRTWWRRWHGDSDAGDGEHARAQGAAGYCRLPTHLGYFPISSGGLGPDVGWILRLLAA
ncbi:MAG: hypothetical protein ABWY93_35890, partial [Mycobacterium sp.]